MKRHTFLLAVMIMIVTNSCGGGSSELQQIEVVFRDRTENNPVEGNFRIATADSVAQLVEFEQVIVLPLASSLVNGQSLVIELIGEVEGFLTSVVGDVRGSGRIIVEVLDREVRIRETSWLSIDGVTSRVLRAFEDPAVYKRKVAMSYNTVLSQARSANSALIENAPNSNDSFQRFRDAYQKALPAFRLYEEAVRDFVGRHPNFSEQSEKLLTVVSQVALAIGLASVSSNAEELNRQIDAYNSLLPRWRDAEFRFNTVVSAFLDS